MSIWSSVDGPDVIGPHDHRDPHSPPVQVDVATTEGAKGNERIRLCMFSAGNLEMDRRLAYAEVHLPIDQAQELVRLLTQAVKARTKR